MIYVLIFVMVQFQRPGSSAVVEFNNIQACQAAAAELRTQVIGYGDGVRVPVLFCAAKGEKK